MSHVRLARKFSAATCLPTKSLLNTGEHSTQPRMAQRAFAMTFSGPNVQPLAPQASWIMKWSRHLAMRRLRCPATAQPATLSSEVASSLRSPHRTSTGDRLTSTTRPRSPATTSSESFATLSVEN